MTAEPQSPVEIVESYLDAVARFDYDAARSWLADADFEYSSPISTYHSADALVRYLQLATPIVQRIKIEQAFAAGPDVAHFLVVTTQLSERLSVNVAQWARVKDGRIQRLQVVFDAHWYRSLFMPDDDGHRPVSNL